MVAAVVRDADCSVNAPLQDGEKVAGRVVALADSVDLSGMKASGLRVGMTNVSDAWLLDWARLFSQRIPAGERPGGTVAGSVALDESRAWQGEVHGEVVGVLPWDSPESSFVLHPISLTSNADGGFVLGPISLTAPGKAAGLVMSGTLGWSGYTVRVAGVGTREQVVALRRLAPPLGDGVDAVLAADAVAGAPVSSAPVSRSPLVKTTRSGCLAGACASEAIETAMARKLVRKSLGAGCLSMKSPGVII